MHVPAYVVKIRDLSGANDTVVAVLACVLALGAGFEPAASAANSGGRGQQARHRDRLGRRAALAQYPMTHAARIKASKERESSFRAKARRDA